MIVIDTSVILALLDRRDQRHVEARDWYLATQPAVATTPLIIAEADHLAGARVGASAQEALRRDLAAGAYAVEWWASALGTVVDVADAYADSGVGLADASLVALAERLDTTGIATFDERHFRAIEPLSGGPAFMLLPMDTPNT